ncbi:MAG: protein TolR [Deltaproteobacteria bacterium]|nr:protein TolR [Deltaproteobacteria bacterium]
MASKRLLSQINVTPFVDVILVLLIIFMVTAPMMQTGIDVSVPEVEAQSIQTQEEPIVVSINSKGLIFINKTEVELAKLGGKLRAVFEKRSDKSLLLKADKRVSYGIVAKTMGEIKKAGINKIGMVTEPGSSR